MVAWHDGAVGPAVNAGLQESRSAGSNYGQGHPYRQRRDGRLALLPAEELVPGDVIEIEAGDVVPADGRVLDSGTVPCRRH